MEGETPVDDGHPDTPVEAAAEARLLRDRNVSATALPIARGTNPIVFITVLVRSNKGLLVGVVLMTSFDDDALFRFSCEANML